MAKIVKIGNIMLCKIIKKFGVIFLFSFMGFLQAGVTYHSQFGQDQYLHKNVFGDKRKGVFVDVGALDGTTDSNTFFFEKYLGWTGICIEPNFVEYSRLANRRKCHCVNVALSSKIGSIDFCYFYERVGWSGILSTLPQEHKKYLKSVDKSKYKIIKVPTTTLNNLCRDYGITHIDYLSIDTEGHEFAILSSINWKKLSVDVIDLEIMWNNSDQVHDLLKKNGFCYLCCIKDPLGNVVDEIWQNAKFRKEYSQVIA